MHVCSVAYAQSLFSLSWLQLFGFSLFRVWSLVIHHVCIMPREGQIGKEQEIYIYDLIGILLIQALSWICAFMRHKHRCSIKMYTGRLIYVPLELALWELNASSEPHWAQACVCGRFQCVIHTVTACSKISYVSQKQSLCTFLADNFISSSLMGDCDTCWSECRIHTQTYHCLLRIKVEPFTAIFYILSTHIAYSLL